MKWIAVVLLSINLVVYLSALNFSREMPANEMRPGGRMPGLLSLKLDRPALGRADKPDSFCLFIPDLRYQDALESSLTVFGGNVQAIEPLYEQQPFLHWLIVPPAKNRQQAMVRLEALREQEVDSFLIEEGTYRWGISLGLFSSRKHAEALREQISAKNIDTRLVRRPSDPVGYAVSVRAVAPGPDALVALIGAHLPEDSGLRLGNRCKGVASPE